VSIRFFHESEQFAEAAREDQSVWEAEGDRIIEALEHVSGLKITERESQAVVYEGISRAGLRGAPMRIRASDPAETKKATLIHELGHRYIMQLRWRPSELDEHRGLFLFLYDVWKILYGQGFAEAQVGHVGINTGLERPWSQYFCCMVAGNREFVHQHPIATKQALRAILKGVDVCALEPERAAQSLVDWGFTQQYDYVLQTMQEAKLATTSFTPVRNEADLIPWRRPRRARPVAERRIAMLDAWAAWCDRSLWSPKVLTG